MTKVALFAVIYPGVEKYLDDFMLSIQNQTFKDFDLVIVNDNCRISNLPSKYPTIRIIELPYSSTIAGNRQYGINYIRNAGYDYLILCDSDDYFAFNRVECMVCSLKSADIVVHDLNIVGPNKELICTDYFSKNCATKDNINKEFIREKNILGFSNSALKLSILHSDVKFPSDVKIVDWYFFTMLIYQGAQVCYIEQSLTNYRQHAANLIGIGDYSLEMFKRMLEQRIYHCALCAELDSFFVLKQKELEILQRQSDEQITNIISTNKINNPYPLWWENITN